MTKRWIVTGVAVAGIVALAAVLITRGAGKPSVATMPTRTAMVGAIEVKLTPVRLSSSEAHIEVTLDTHSEALSMPLAGRFEVGGVAWDGGTWTGDGPGGHHRKGILHFEPGSVTKGTAQLTLTGLSRPVVTTWQMP